MAWKRSLNPITGFLIPNSFAVVLALIPSLREEYQHILLAGGIVGLGVGIVIWLIGKPKLKEAKEELPMSGDTYNNSGNNYGHMGPVHIGRQKFVFTNELGQEILAKVPRNKPLPVQIVGSMHAQQVGHQIVNFLKLNGYMVSEIMTIGVMAPPPSGPLSYDGESLTIAADL